MFLPGPVSNTLVRSLTGCGFLCFSVLINSSLLHEILLNNFGRMEVGDLTTANRRGVKGNIGIWGICGCTSHSLLLLPHGGSGTIILHRAYHIRLPWYLTCRPNPSWCNISRSWMDRALDRTGWPIFVCWECCHAGHPSRHGMHHHTLEQIVCISWAGHWWYKACEMPL